MQWVDDPLHHGDNCKSSLPMVEATNKDSMQLNQKPHVCNRGCVSALPRTFIVPKKLFPYHPGLSTKSILLFFQTACAGESWGYNFGTKSGWRKTPDCNQLNSFVLPKTTNYEVAWWSGVVARDQEGWEFVNHWYRRHYIPEKEYSYTSK